MTQDDEQWEAPTTHDRKPPEEASDVIALDRVRADEDIITVPVDRARIAVVATGDDAARVRRLCHESSLYVPVMANVGIVHDSLAVVVIGEPSPPAPARVVHVIRPTVGDDALRALLRALASGRAIAAPPRPGAIDPRVTAALKRLDAARSLIYLENTSSDAVIELTGADRAYCLFHEATSGALWSEVRKKQSGDDRSAFAGLAGWAARTGLPAHAACAGDDPRWLPDIDDPEGKAQTRIAVEPVVVAGHTRAVLVAVRRWRHADFTEVELGAFARFADNAGAVFERVMSRPAPPPPPAPAARAEPSSTLTGMPSQAREPAPSLADRIAAAEAEVSAARKKLEAAELVLVELRREAGGEEEPGTEPFEKIDPE